MVTLNGEGKVVGFNGKKFGILKDFKGNYSEEDVESAKQAIIDKINSFPTEIVGVGKPLIEANPSGEVFVTLNIETRERNSGGKEYTAIDTFTTPLRFQPEQ